ncbi:MAG: 2-C-methyl-D-erythritol 2,4-cyclodiphosphate synthase [Gammaproteobacteria bacterium]|nr:2-C-methyl-D-erythritol 2,4-cyclodiphosphate synthase [Gammaproteobacteria bacterium]
MSQEQPPKLPPYRIGHGYDVHRFGEGDAIVLGGVKIPHHSGFIAHSDGDVLIHALCDALLGGIAAGDIGQHFPDTDDKYKNIDSSVLLGHTDQLLKNAQYAIVNIDLTIVAQSPKMAPHLQAMIQNLAAVLNITQTQINIKATTTETLGFAGREEGIAVHAVAMLYRKAD